MGRLSEKRPGLGTFAMESRDSGGFAGFCVARQVGYDPASHEYEIGYIFTPECRGQGMASELVPPLCRYCFGQSPAKHLVAFTYVDNAASQRVLIKSGFRYMGTRQTTDGTSAEFWLERAAFLVPNSYLRTSFMSNLSQLLAAFRSHPAVLKITQSLANQATAARVN